MRSLLFCFKLTELQDYLTPFITSYLNPSSRVTSDSTDSSLCLFLLPFLCSLLLLLLGSMETNGRWTVSSRSWDERRLNISKDIKGIVWCFVWYVWSNRQGTVDGLLSYFLDTPGSDHIGPYKIATQMQTDQFSALLIKWYKVYLQDHEQPRVKTGKAVQTGKQIQKGSVRGS